MKLVKHLFTERASDNTIAAYWRITLLVGAAVIGVVAFLLHVLSHTAAKINDGASEVWRVGKLIANNTVHIPLLVRTNQVAGEILKASEGIAGATTRIGKAVVGTPDTPGTPGTPGTPEEQ